MPEKTITKNLSLSSFRFMLHYGETDKSSHVFEIDLHAHKELEIYINLSGDVSFLIENQLYPLTRGDIAISRPGAYHHCVYRSEAKHTFFWILFDIGQNQELLQFLSDSRVSFISLAEDLKQELIELCFHMLAEGMDALDELYGFIRFMTILKNYEKNDINRPDKLPGELLCMLEYIDGHLSEELKIIDMAKALHFSESTIERRFKEHLGIRPLAYIQKKKMLLASELLRRGESVLGAGIGAGYSDNSYFIQLFKRFFGMTPKQYIKYQAQSLPERSLPAVCGKPVPGMKKGDAAT